MTAHQDLAHPGTTLLFENDHVRVWEIVLQPGERLGMHAHELPYCFVVIEPATVRSTFIDGSEPVVATQPAGEVVFRTGGELVHDLTNIGTTRYVNRVIEWKSGIRA